MNIGILLGSPGISGGSYVIYEHASRLKRRGHRVAIITRKEVRPEEHAWHSSAKELDWLTVKQARAEFFDIVLATWWETFFLLRQIKSAQYAYFVQSIESRFFNPPNPLDLHNTDTLIWQGLCEKTYACAIPVITEATWIQEYLHTNCNKWPYLVRNGIRKDIYTADGEAIEPRRPGCFRVLVEGPAEVCFKNVPSAIRLAKKAGADEIWLLTSSDMQQHPDVDRVFSRIPIHETPAVYRSCDLVLKLSYIEGMFGPPLEMFHCGGTALVYDVTGHDEYIVHDRNAYVVDTDNEDEVIRLLRHLKDNPAELARLKQGAAETAAAWPDWEVCAAQFEETLLNIAAGKPASRKYLSQYTRDLFGILKSSVKAKTQEAFVIREKAYWVGTMSDRHNFGRLFWDGQGEFIDKQSQWQHYQSEEWTTLSFELRVEEVPLWLRIDPSARIGMIDIAFISVRNTTQDKTILVFQEPDEFQTLFLVGDLKWILSERKNAVFSYAQHPGFILPEIESHHAKIGDMLEISIKLRETGVQQFFNEHYINISGRREEQSAVEDEEAAEDETAEDEEQSSGRNNMMHLYWEGDGEFSDSKSQWQHYPGDEWVTLSFTLQADEIPLWLRIDPSRCSGMIEIAFIAVRNATRQTEIMAFQEQDEFRTLFFGGDLRWIFSDRKDVAFSSGNYPFLLLPQIKADQADSGDLLEVSIKLKETRTQQFFDEHPVSFADRMPPPAPEPAPVPWQKRILRRIA